MFLALDARGDVFLSIPRRPSDLGNLRVGEKLTVSTDATEPLYHVDAVHPVGADTVVVNGDRRLRGKASMVDVATLVSWFVKQAGDQSIFFGCTPHQPGSWWIRDERTVALHEKGFVDIVAADPGFLARRIMDDGLYFLPREAALAGLMDQWRRVYTSPLGNLLMLERRLLHDQLVLSCRDGLIEVDLYDLPRVTEAGRFPIRGGFAVLGRITGGAFAVARGTPMEWGFEGITPATLVGSHGCTFMELRQLLREKRAADDIFSER
jgi:hypothetical protein